MRHIHVPPARLSNVRLKDSELEFEGFDRPPYLAGFRLGKRFTIQLANVHLYFGSDAQEDRERRALETAAIARWARLWSESSYSGARELMLLGDPSTSSGQAFNLLKESDIGKRACPERPRAKRGGVEGWCSTR